MIGFDCCCGSMTAHVFARDCSGHNLAGEVVGVAGPGGFTASGTTAAAGGTAFVDIPLTAGPGDYTFTAGGTSFTVAMTGSGGVVVVCEGGGNFTLSGTVSFGCPSHDARGLTVVATQLAVTSGSDGGAIGIATVTGPAGGPYTWTMCCSPNPDNPTSAVSFHIDTPPAYYQNPATPVSVPVPVACGSHAGIAVGLVPADGYAELCCLSDMPVPDTLTLTDKYGDVTLTLVGAHWEGSHTVSYPGCATAGVNCPPATVTISYRLQNGPSGTCGLVIQYNACGDPVGGSGERCPKDGVCGQTGAALYPLTVTGTGVSFAASTQVGGQLFAANPCGNAYTDPTNFTTIGISA